MRHTRTGWWLEEAGDVTPQAPLADDASADVVVVGGGYLGLWTAWQLRQLEPALDVLVLEAALCGHGPSGRNGGFCETLWGDAPTLRKKVGDAKALAVCRASEDAVLGVLPLFWTVLVPVAVAAVIACSIALARRDAAPA